MSVRLIDLADDAVMSQVHGILCAEGAFERPHFVPQTAAAMIATMRQQDPLERFVLWGVWADGRLVGATKVWLPLQDNLDTMWFEVSIHPDHRRRGHGSAALATVVAFAQEHGRTRILTSVRYPEDRAADHPYRRFAEHHGFRIGQTDLMRLLPLPVPDEVLAAFAEQARAAYAGAYRVQTFTEVPRPLWPSLCECQNRVETEAPTGELDFEPESLDVGSFEVRMANDREVGRLRLTSVAVDEATGEVVAYTELVLDPDITRAQQSGTIVLPEHRGHRLGLAVKVANLVALQAGYPQRRDVATINAHDNPWMVGINERLGFRVVEACPSFYRLLARV